MGLCCLNKPRLSDSQAESAAQRWPLSGGGGEDRCLHRRLRAASGHLFKQGWTRNSVFFRLKWTLFCRGGLTPPFSQPLLDEGYLSIQDKSLPRRLGDGGGVELLERLQYQAAESLDCLLETQALTQRDCFSFPPKVSRVFFQHVATRARVHAGNGIDNTSAQPQLSIMASLWRWNGPSVFALWFNLDAAVNKWNGCSFKRPTTDQSPLVSPMPRQPWRWNRIPPAHISGIYIGTACCSGLSRRLVLSDAAESFQKCQLWCKHKGSDFKSSRCNKRAKIAFEKVGFDAKSHKTSFIFDLFYL